jgi:hypothetical protein
MLRRDSATQLFNVRDFAAVVVSANLLSIDDAARNRHRPAIGRQLVAQRLDAADGQGARPPEIAKCLVVGIDDTYVKHREQLIARQFQVTAARIERNGKLGARFVFVSSNPAWTANFFDGFLLQTRSSAVSRDCEMPSGGVDHGRRCSSSHGCAQIKLCKQGAAGHRISTAHVESVMNHPVNHRLSKKQQMRWSPEGAHYLLQVRAELLDGTLIDAYRVANPRFRGSSGFAQAVH